MIELQVVYNCTSFCTTHDSSCLIFYGFKIVIIFNSSKIKHLFHFNQPWYFFFFFDTYAATAVAIAVAAGAGADAGAADDLMVI